jgi:hypothetical protein
MRRYRTCPRLTATRRRRPPRFARLTNFDQGPLRSRSLARIMPGKTDLSVRFITSARACRRRRIPRPSRSAFQPRIYRAPR